MTAQCIISDVLCIINFALMNALCIINDLYCIINITFAKEYKHLAKKKGDTALHACRFLNAQAALLVVYQHMPQHYKFFSNDVETATPRVLPFLEHLFQMPKSGPAEGSPQWLKKRIQNPDIISSSQAVKYRALRDAKVTMQKAMLITC